MNTLPDDYTPQVSTKPVDPSIEGSGYYLLIDDVIVDQSWKEVDLFDEHAKAILSEPHRAFLWRESARVLNSLPRKPLRERRIDWCEMGQHQMQPSQSYCYSRLNIRACKGCLDAHIETYFPKREQNESTYYIDPVHSPSYAASSLGRLGGSVKSEAKSTASRANGRKGGRPKSTKSIDMEDI